MADASQKKLRQILEMLIMLGNSPFGRTKTSLAQHFSIDKRTVDRYFETFKDVGFVIDQYKKGYYYINKEFSEYKDLSQLLHFSEEESAILRNAIDSIDTSSIIKEQLFKKLYSIYNFDRVATPLVKKNEARSVENLSKAMRETRQVILINYKSGNSQTETNRLVEPFDFTHNFNAVWAYEPASEMCKTFKISRICKVKISNTLFLFKNKHHKNKLDIFRMTGETPVKVEVKLTVKAFTLLIEEYPLAEKYTEKINENHYLLQTIINDSKGLLRFVLGLPNDCEIIKPDSIKNEILETLKNNIKKFETRQ